MAPSPVRDKEVASTEPMIDPELADLPPPPHHSSNGSNGSTRIPGEPTSITESIASAPNPHTTDFSPLPFTQDESQIPVVDDEPGSPTARLLRALAPPNAAQPDPKWPPPPPNASVNLFIGRALLSNGNDNWPLKPNDIVNWIRKHYPEEWDGDEGRCSAHRVRTYLARKGADMYYEKLNQGCIAGWRIRQNHLWRFENGGFQGRGMKQEEALAQQAKENEAMQTAVHKAAAAAALAQGHPGIKVSMSSSVSDAANKRRKPNGQARRKNEKKKTDEFDYAATAQQYATFDTPAADTTSAGASSLQNLEQVTEQRSEQQDNLDASMVQQAMAAANAVAGVGQMDELEMGMQLPIEMQMHSESHDDRDYYDSAGNYAQGSYDYNQQGQYQDNSYQQGQQQQQQQ